MKLGHYIAHTKKEIKSIYIYNVNRRSLCTQDWFSQTWSPEFTYNTLWHKIMVGKYWQI